MCTLFLTADAEFNVSVQQLIYEVSDLKESITELKESIKFLLTNHTSYQASMENNMRAFEEDYNYNLKAIEANILEELQSMSNATKQHVIQTQIDHQALQTSVGKQECGYIQDGQIGGTYPISKPNYPTIPNRPTNPCAEIARRNKSVVTSSGEYWVQNAAGASVRVYCNMKKACCGYTGEWVRVAYLNMSNSSHSCPSGFSEYSAPRRCGYSSYYNSRYRQDTRTGCVKVTYPSNGIEYQRVCGRVTAYQKGTTDAFYSHYSAGTHITSYYVDGVSITHGGTKNHIWTFAAAHDELRADQWRCPCSRVGQNFTGYIPLYVGNDYFCDAGTSNFPDPAKTYTMNPIWDGSGCGSSSSCCSFNSPPWFCKPLPRPTTDNIELRVCRDQDMSDEDIHIELIEIYIG